jgi:hypothetical protein
VSGQHFIREEQTPSTHWTESQVGPETVWIQRLQQKTSALAKDQTLLIQPVFRLIHGNETANCVQILLASPYRLTFDGKWAKVIYTFSYN